MKAMNSTIVRLFVTALIALLPMVVSAVTYTNRYQEEKAVVPAAAFQSTSVMVGSGSGLVATPKLNADGTVNTEIYGMGQASPSNAHPGRPKTIAPPVPDGNPSPLGDGLWALLIMAMVYTLVRVCRSSKESAE